MATYTTALRADQVPAPVVPSSDAYLESADTMGAPGSPLAPFTSGMTTGLSTMLNKLLVAIENLGRFGGNGIGIASGLSLTFTPGLNCQISAGVAMIGSPVTVPSALTGITMTDNSANYVWLLQSGVPYVATTTTPPAGQALYLGKATAASGVVTNIDTSGVLSIKGGNCVRVTADRGMPKDTPSSAMNLRTITLAGSYDWDGSGHRPQGEPTYEATLTGDLTLDEYDARHLVLTPSGAHRNVRLAANPRADQTTTIVNKSATGGYNVVVKTPDGATTLITLTPGKAMNPQIPVADSSGNLKYPISSTEFTETVYT